MVHRNYKNADLIYSIYDLSKWGQGQSGFDSWVQIVCGMSGRRQVSRQITGCGNRP